MTDSPHGLVTAPGVARGRRAFLAPVWLTILGVVLAGTLAAALWRNQTTTTIIVLRHAEKQVGAIADAPLSSEGALRAQSLLRLFGETRSLGAIGAIYVSDTRRSQQTAAPLAQRLGISPSIRDAKDTHTLVDEILQQHRGEVVMIVGHSNTVPALIAELTRGRYQVTVGESDYGQLWIVSRPSLGPAALVALSF